MASRLSWLPILGVLACGEDGSADGDASDTDAPVTTDDPSTFTTSAGETADVPLPTDGPPPGNPDGDCEIPAEAGPADSSNPRTVVGDGTPESCTGDAFVEAVASGGVITFDCGPDPVTITLDRTAKIFNDTGPDIVIDGGGLVTLDGGNAVRILYMNTCDQAQNWTTPMCDNQDHPRLTVQNLTFVRGNASGEDPDGGGAIFARGGRLKVVNSRFFSNRCDDVGPDVGGGGIRAFDQFDDLPLYVVNSTFGGEEGLGNECSNGGGINSIGVSYTVINSLFSHNRTTGNGANPMRPGTPGGGNGGAICTDGNTITLTLCGVSIHDNTANEGGGAVFFTSNDMSGGIVIRDSVLSANPSLGFESEGFPGIFYVANGPPMVEGSVIE
jgi:hypothetical protein